MPSVNNAKTDLNTSNNVGSNRKRANKLKTLVTTAAKENEIIIKSKTKVSEVTKTESNISGIAKLGLKLSDSTDFRDLQSEIETSNEPTTLDNESNKIFKRNLVIISLSVVIVASAIVSTIFQSILLSEHHFFFPFPVFSAAVNNLVQLVGAGMILGYYGGIRKLSKEIWSVDGWKATYQAILPCSLVTAAELSITLVSLQYVSVSFFTMVKSSSIVFILLGSFMTGQERVNTFLLSVILLTSVGVIFAAWDPKSTAGLEIVGFSLVILSSILNAAKWILTELLLNENVAFKGILKKLNEPTSKHSKPRNLTPLLSVLLIAPITLVCLLIASAAFEGFPLHVINFIMEESFNYMAWTMGSLILISILLFVIRLADFRIVQLVSLVTFSLLGIIKQILMILISVIFLKEILFPINVFGLIVTLIGVGLYNYYRILERRQAEALKQGTVDIELQLRKKNNQILPVPVK